MLDFKKAVPSCKLSFFIGRAGRQRSPSMSDLFIGLTMLVTLSSPPGAQLRGKVSSVLAGQSLTLRDGASSNLSLCYVSLIYV